ncbi:MAG: YkgJ family cysteine cluster protein [Ilumatobacteraceae bacterium]
MSAEQDVAVDFGDWLSAMDRALREQGETDVPCATCSACCTSAQFVHIGPDETDTIAHVPSELLFPAPGGSPGEVLLGYDERGHCPMLTDGRCSIYEHRPVACRTYDCRIFAATGVAPDQPAVAERVRGWSFMFADDTARAEHQALLSAVDEVRAGGVVPVNATALAVRAVEVSRRKGR